jgi:acyl-coenzyme A thioesterase PaaI-like protein
MNETQSVQERYAPALRCFGCGPANESGLRIRSLDAKDGLVAEWRPLSHHEAFPGVLCGGIIGTLLDCHSNWTAAITLMKARGLDHPPCTVTAEYAVKLLRPTPTAGPVTLRAHAVEVTGDRVVVDATLEAGGKICDSCRGTFVAVTEGHPAWHRW